MTSTKKNKIKLIVIGFFVIVSIIISIYLSFSKQKQSTSTKADEISNEKCVGLDDKLAKYDLPYKSGYTGMPKTSPKILTFDKSHYYSIPYRNSNCNVTQDITTIKQINDDINSFYQTQDRHPNGFLENYQYIQTKAKQYGFNPIFVVALWIEESAAGGISIATQFGCDFMWQPDPSLTPITLRGGDTTNICDQMQCLFALGAARPDNYEVFACNYLYGTYPCPSEPSFVQRVEYWYQKLSPSDQMQDCKPAYFNYKKV